MCVIRRRIQDVEVLMVRRSPGNRFMPGAWVFPGGMVDAADQDPDLAELIAEPVKNPSEEIYRSPGHHRDWLDCIKQRRDPVAHAEAGHRSATICHLGNIAIRLGRKLVWDPVAERFPKDEQANRLIAKPMRSPWSV